MALAGDVGADIAVPDDGPLAHAWLFGEDQARYVVTTRDADAVVAAAEAAGVPARRIGTTGGAALTVSGARLISVSELRTAHEGWLPSYMAGP